MKRFRFYKESDGRWYVDLPEWTGDKANLEMVSGADLMLNMIAEGESETYLSLSEEYFEGSNKLEFINLTTELGEGATYKLHNYQGVIMDFDIWLCGVTTFVFGNYPKIIYFYKSI